MTLPQILVVDDQYARDPTERRRLLRHTGMRDISLGCTHQVAPVRADAVFCSGQRSTADKRVVNDPALVIEAIEVGGAKTWALVLLDMRFDSGVLNADGEPRGGPGDDEFGEVVRRQLRAEYPELPVVVLTSKRHAELVDLDVAYLSKDRLDSTALTASLLRHGRLTPDQARSLLELAPQVVAQDSVTVLTFKQAWFAASLRSPVLILGETGVGKEVLARYIHDRSGRREFVGLNIAAVPSTLFEAEMFGAAKGAATGVTSTREGFIERANLGTLFLDEIADMDADAQAKVLRALEEQKAYRVGERHAYAFDVRLISATSRDLVRRIAAGQFREDLYYRIAAETIVMPPLRERRDDIATLASVMIEDAAQVSGKDGITLSPDAVRRLELHEFRGNARELRHVVRRLVAIAGRNQVLIARDVEQVLGAVAGNLGSQLAAQKLGDSRSTASGGVRSAEAEPNPLASSNELAGALKGASETYGRAVWELIERALEQTRHASKGSGREVGELNPTGAMKLLLGRRHLTTVQAADEIKRIAAATGEPAPGSLFAQVLEWARRLRGAGLKLSASTTEACR